MVPRLQVFTLIPLVSSSSKEPMSKASAALTSPLGGMRGGGYCNQTNPKTTFLRLTSSSCKMMEDYTTDVDYIHYITVGSNVSRQARRSHRAPPVLPQHFNRVVIKSGTDTLKYDCRPQWIPNIIGLEYCHSDMPVSHWIRVLAIAACKGWIWSAQCY